ncbi:MAG: EAL domain-containing protein [Gammaproteobacteria bacterium]
MPLTPDPPFRVYSVAEGLNQKTVLAIAQDHDGFLWIATFGGLNRFDGRTFESYTTRQGLRQNLIQALFVDSENRVWAGDAAGGLTVIKDGQVVRTFAPEDSGRGVARSIIQVGDLLYIGSQPGGVRSLSLSNLDEGPVPIPDAPSEVLTLVARGDGEIVALSSIGLHLYRPDAKPQFTLIREGVTALASDASGRIAVGDQAGRVGWLEGNTINWLPTRYGGGVIVLAMKDGEITWLLVEGQGFRQFGDPDAPVLLPAGGDGYSLYDSEGVFWVPDSTGLARYLGSRFQHFSLEIDGVRPEVFSIVPGAYGDYWFGTSLGLLHADRDGLLTNTSDQLGIERREVRDVRLSSDDKTLWIGQVRGPVHAIDVASGTIRKTLGDATSLTVSLELDDQDRVWFGSYIGSLTVHDDATDTTWSFDLGTGASVYTLDFAQDGVMWFGANYNGIFRIDTRNADAEPEQVVSDASLGEEIYTQVVAGDDGVVWFTGIQGGVFKWQDGDVSRVVPETELADNTVYSIAPLPDNTLVLATSRGAYRFDLETETMEQYAALEGFVAIEAKVHSNFFDGDHSLMIGTTSGVTVMDVRVPMAGVGTPTPKITRRTVDETDVIAGSELPTDAAYKNVRIQFTALSTRNPLGLEYSYRLTGQSNEWSVPTQTTSIEYSTLKPGAYVFQVRARLPRGDFGDATSWSFTVPTPFWRTSWFIALATALAMGLIWLMIRLRLQSIARINRRLRREVAERTQSIEAGRHELELSYQELERESRQRQKADARRADVEARFHQAYQNSPMGMALVDTEGLVYDANPKMKTMFWPNSAPDDREPLVAVVAQADRERFSAYLESCADATTDQSSMEFDCLDAEDAWRRIDFHPSAVRDHDERLKYIVVIAHDVTESRAMTDQLEYQASFDELTGLVNRRAFSARLEEVGAASATSEDAFLMFLDLDQFKVVNDTCGHAAGDELLRKVSKLIRKCVRDHDTVARLGGDEFALILVGCSEEVAMQRAEDVRQSIQDLEFLWGQDVFRIGVSIGVVPVNHSIRDLNELQQLADAACYAAKEAGRNRVHLVAGKSDAVHEHRGEMRWVQRLNHAIDNDSFVLFGQCILPLGTPSISAERIEVLLRMRDRKSDRLIPPGAFMPAAERYGLQGRLDQWVVRNVIEVLTAQAPETVATQQYWVNLSGASVGDPKISHELVRIVEAAKLPRGCLNFEITETAVIRKIDDAATLISALQEMGCRFALDDFGSGLSSFGYLKRLNVDCIKIDGQFVRDITSDPTDRIFVKSIIDIAHTLGMRVVAEFVEDEKILDMVRALGSDYAQGFGVHRPEPLAKLVDIDPPRRAATLGG